MTRVPHELIPSTDPVLHGLGRYQGPCMEQAVTNLLRAAGDITADAVLVSPVEAAGLRAWYGPPLGRQS